MRFRTLVACLSFALTMVTGAIAQNSTLPTVPENGPYLAYIHGAVADGSYNASTEVFSLTGTPSAFYLPNQTAFCNVILHPACPSPGISLAIQVDNNGNLIGGNPVAGQPDFEVVGQITSGATTYTSPLLTGTVTQFFYDGVNDTPNFEIRIAVTGGSMASLYLNPPSLDNDLWMTINLESVGNAPDFAGSFATSWSGEVKGNVYSTPGQCFGTIGDFVWNDLNANGIQDAGEPGINGVTVNLYNSQGSLLQSVVTQQGPTGSQLGYYQFTGVCAGTYTVQVDTTTLPKNANGEVGFVPTTVNAPGSTTANDSNPNPSTVTLSTNDSSDETIDFGFIALQGAIGDYVWYDANRNGLQDANETGINGVEVELYDSTQTNLLATTTTAYGGPNNVNGYYQFTGLGAGSYVVVVNSATLPPNYTPTTSFVGSNTAIDSNGSPAPVTLPTDSSVDETIDFGYVSPCNGTIGQFVWHDLNQNGIQDAGEPGISGITLDLYNSSYTLIQTGITNGSGYYLFSGLCAGTYTVTVVGSTLPPNFTPTIPQATGSTPENDSVGSPAPVTLTTDSNNNVVSDLNVNFGYVSPCNGAIGDFVWWDENGNGIQDVGEPGIANVTVSLYNSQMTLLNATTTNQVGYYQFTGLCAGTYIVQVTPPAGYSPTIVNAPGSTTANDSNPSPSTVVLSITDSNGDITNDETIDFGFVLPALTVTCGTVSSGEVGVPFDSGPMTVTGGLAPYTFSVVGTLPAGLTLNTSTGEVTGTPTAAGSFSVEVTDSVGEVSTGCAITISSPLSVSCAAVTAGEVGVAFDSGPMTVTGGLAPYTFSAVGVLPAGLTLNATTGAVTGTPTAAGSFTVQVKDALGATSAGCQITINTALSVTCAAVTAGEVGVAFNSGPMTVTGGTAPYTFSIVGTLPAGLTLNTTTGAVTGTPTAAGSFTVQVKDALGATSTGCQITINAALSVTCAAVTAGEVGGSFNSGPMTVTGGTAPYTFSIVGTLPAGLTLNTTTGAVTGTPTAAGSFTVQVKDALGATSAGCQITINTALSVTCAAVTAGEVGVAFNSGPMTVTGGTAPYTFSIVGTLPAGLTLNTTTGAVTGTPTAAGSFTVQVKDALGATSTGCQITINAALSVTCAAVTAGEVGGSFNSGPMTVTGGTAPYTFSIVGTLPAGLTLNTTTGAVTGTPTAAGSFTVQVKDALGATSAGCQITINTALSVTCAAVTAGEVGVAFNSGPMTVTGGTAPYTFSIIGTLPAGLTLNATTGAVTGTPTAAGSFTVQVKDALGATSAGCQITINTALSVTCAAVTAGEVGVAFNSGPMTVTGGTAPYTFSIIGTLPAGLTLNATTGAVTGTPTAAGSFTVQVKDALRATSAGCQITINTALSVTCAAVTAGEVGVAFNSGPMTVTGGTAPYTFSIIGTLPAGLTLNATTGAVTGTPTAAGSFTVQVKDALGATSAGCQITINTALSVTCAAVTAGEVGVAFNSGPMTVTGGTAPYTFSIVGTLPAGLTLNTTTGAVTGTPTAAGSFTVQVKDALGATSTGCQITINAALSVTCAAVTAGEVGGSFNSGPMTVTGGTAPYTFSIVGTLPAGLTLNTTTGAVTGTPTAAGSFTVQVKDALGATSAGCQITINTALSVTCAAVTAGEVGVAFNSGPMTVTGGTAPYTFSIIGTLPAGLTLNATTGAVTGTPTAAGSFTVQVKDALGATSAGCQITINTALSVTCAAVTAGEVGVAFNSGPMTVTGGTAPYTFSIVGTLPAGLTLNTTTGAVTGTPTAAGSFTVQVKDALGATSTGCQITINAALSVTCAAVTAGEVGGSFNSGPMTVTGGTAPYTFSIVGTLPAGLTLNTTTGAVTGTPTAAGSFTVQVKDALGATSTGCQITINAALSVTCAAVTAGEVGGSFNSGPMTVTGGTAPYTFSIVGTLPAGLTLNTTTGAVTGTPTAAGSFTVQVKDALGATSAGCQITINTALSVTCAAVTAGEVGVAFNSGPMTVTGGTAPYTFSIVGTLPAGLTLNTTTGAVTGTPTAAGSFTVQVKDALGATSTGCQITINAALSVTCAAVTAGEVGGSFNSGPMTVTGGTAPYTFSIVGTLPAGLTLNTTTGAVTGTPTAAGSFTVQVKDALGATSAGCQITINTALSVTCAAVTAGEVGVAFNSGPMTVTGGTAPYTFSIIGTLPAGLTLNATTGAVTGTPTAAGSFTVQVKDALGATSAGCQITINTALSVTCAAVTAGEVGVAFNSGPMTVTGGTAPYTFSIIGTLPAGLTLNATTGAVTGTPTAAGSFTVQVKDALGATSAGCQITINTALSVTCAAVTAGEVGVAFNSGPMTVTGGTAPYTFSIIGTLPAGLTLNATTGAVTGTPTAAGSFTVQVKDALGATSAGCQITINTALSVTCAAVTAGEVGVAFNSGPMTVTGGTAPYTFSIVGTLPAGLTLNTTTGAVTGTPTAAGSFTVQVKDALGATSTGCQITINAALSVTCAAVTAGEVGGSFNSGPMTVTGGTAPYTFSIVGTLPAGLTLNTTTGAVTGTPTAAGSFTVQVKDALGATSAGCQITINTALSVTCAAVTAGEVGVAFNSGPMTVTGGTAPYTFSIIGTLPAGLTLNATTGAVTGTPTAAGSFTVQVKDALGATSAGCQITINTALSVTCAAVTAGEVGVAFNSGPMTVTGGTAPYTFSIVGTLPAGLTLNTTTGAVTGTPTAAGSFTVQVKDALGATSTGCQITINAALSVTCAAVTAGEVGGSFNSGPMTVTGGTAPYTFSIVGTLPAGLTLNTTTGAVTGTPTAAGSFTVQVKDALGATSAGCQITINTALSVTCAAVTAGEVGVAFNSGPMTVTGGTAPYTFSIIGTLPAGLTLNATTGAVTGTPTAAGSFTVQVKDALGATSAGCQITINTALSVTCAAVTAGEVGVAFNSGPMTVTGGTAPYTFSIVGTLPAGLTLNTTTGAVTGTPTAAGSFTVQVKDALGATSTGCQITIVPAVSATCVSIDAVQGDAIVSATLVGSGGTGPYTFTATGLPTGLTISSSGVISGTPTVSGTFSYTVTITDSKGNKGTLSCSITVLPPVSVSCVTFNAVQGVAITPVSLTGSGGAGGAYTYSATGLPPGLTMSSSGVISGTPTASGTFNYTVTITDTGGYQGSGRCSHSSTLSCSITVAPAVSATCVSIDAVQGNAIVSATLVGSGGTGPYTFMATGLPSGLSISSAGVISGTPTVSGTFSYTVTITDSKGDKGTLSCSITVLPPVSVSCVTFNAVQGVAITPVSLTGSGGAGGAYTYSATGLPPGLTMSSSGVISGTPTASGTFNYTVTITDTGGNQGSGRCSHQSTLSCSITVAPAVSATCVSIDAVQGNAIVSATLVGSGGTGPYTFTATGLPSGLSISSAGVISGTPTVSGTFSYTVTITDSKGNKGTLSCSITVLPPVSVSCVTFNAVQGVAITPVSLTGSGGAGGAYTYSATGLPPGLTMSSSGVISGTPTASGTFNYTVTITDTGGNQGSGRCSHQSTLSCSITVAPAVSATCVSIDAVQGNAIVSATLVGSGGTGPYTFTATGLPSGLSISSAGVISGTPTVSGTFSYTVTITDSKGNKGTLSCSITVLPPVSVSCVTFNAVQGVAITPVSLTGSGGAGGAYTYSATGLPPGLTMSSSGVISGTPTASGTFNYTVTITDTGGNQGSGRCSHQSTLSCSITVAPAVSGKCGSWNPVQGSPFTPVKCQGSGGTGSGYTFKCSGLPPGMKMSSSGTVYGTPTSSGTYHCTVTITDGAGNTGTVNCSVTVSSPSH